MKFSQSIIALSAAAGIATAAPTISKRAAITDGMSCFNTRPQSFVFGHLLTYYDRSADILNYALTLEHLEDKFYREGLANFTQSDFAAAGYNATFYANLMEVSSDETTHVSFLTKALTGESQSLPKDLIGSLLTLPKLLAPCLLLSARTPSVSLLWTCLWLPPPFWKA